MHRNTKNDQKLFFVGMTAATVSVFMEKNKVTVVCLNCLGAIQSEFEV